MSAAEPRPCLTLDELHMLASIVNELARLRGTSFDKTATGWSLTRAALIDPAFKARIAGAHARLEEIGPIVRDLEREAERVLSR